MMTETKQGTAAARSTFAAILAELLDATGFYTRAQWAQFLRVSTPAISQWVNDRTLPRADLLAMVIDILRVRGGPHARDSLARFDAMATREAADVSPFGLRMAPSVKAYIEGASLAGLGQSLRDLRPEEQHQVLSGSWMQRDPKDFVQAGLRSAGGQTWLGAAAPVLVDACALQRDLLPRVARLLPSGKQQPCDLEAMMLNPAHVVLEAGPGTGKTRTLAMLGEAHYATNNAPPVVLPGLAFCGDGTAKREPLWSDASGYAGATLVLIDGFDEIPAGERSGAAEGILSLSNRCPGIKVVVASRPVPELSILKGYHRFSLGGLSHLQMVRTVMRSLDQYPDDSPSLGEVTRFLCHFSETEGLQKPLRHPLFLDHAWKLFKTRAVTPFAETHILAECIRGLFERDAYTRVVRCREPWTSTENMSELASEVAYKSLMARKVVFTESDVANWIEPKYHAIDARRLAWSLAEQGILTARNDVFEFSEMTVRDYLSASHVVKGCDGALAYLGDWKIRSDLRHVLRMACGITNDATALLNGILAAGDVGDATRYALLAEILAQPISANRGVLAECCCAVAGWLDGELRDWLVSDPTSADDTNAGISWRLLAAGRPTGGSQRAVHTALAAVHRARSGPACDSLKHQFGSATSSVLPAFAECLDFEGRLKLHFVHDTAGEILKAEVSDVQLY